MNELTQVCIVEDNEAYRETVQKAINGHAGFQCMLAFGSVEPLLEALDEGVVPDILLMDVHLPGMDGVEGVARVKAQCPALHVLMLTIKEDDDTIFRAIQAGASGYLLKMSRLSTIIEALGTTARGGAFMSPQIARRTLTMFNRLVTPQAEYELSQREKDVLGALIEGKTKAQIADMLHLSPHTIDTHTRNIYGKLHVHNRAEAVVKAVKERLL